MFKKKRRARASRSTTYYPNKSKRVTSRLAKREQKKIFSQTVFFLVSALILGIVFVIFILPSSVNLLFNFLDSGETVMIDDSLPPQTPIVSAPEPASKDQEINITGFAQLETEVVLILNSNEHARKDVDADGKFEISVNLEKGKNLISLYAVTDKGKESEVSKEYEVIYDSQAPEIEITSPEDGASLEGKDNQTVEILGKTESGAKLFINERLAFANADGEFKSNLRLEEGDNNIIIKAIDKAGNETEMELSLKFRF